MGGGAGVAFGTAGWSYADWAGRIFAPGERDGLGQLARVFDAAEVNSTYYRVPAPELARGWLKKVSHNPTFSFTLKLWRGFTHDRRFGQKDVDAFLSLVDPLRDGGRLGGLLAQFPWSFREAAAPRRWVERLARAFAGLPLFVEFRHASWAGFDLAGWLAGLGVGLCNIDQPPLRDTLGPGEQVVGETGYVRLHGRNAADWFRAEASRDERYDYCYRPEELLPWAARIRRMASRARRIFVITNNHFQGQAVVNALELRALVTGETARVPARWLESWPRLARCAVPETATQRRLFS